MFTTRIVQRKAPWAPLVFASAALGLAVYYLNRRPPSPSGIPKQSQTHQQPCQDSDVDDNLDLMSSEDRAYHEGFMREAIAMVDQLRLANMRAS